MQNDWQSLFRSIGFLDTEAKVYLACLELGPATAQEISRKAKVSRVTTYSAIETLTERGLMSSIMKEKRKRFMVEAPEKLISYAEGRIKYAEDAVQLAKSSMDDLKFLQKGDGPIVRIFEGHDALKAIQEDVIQTNPTTIDEIGNFDEIDKVYDRGNQIRPFIEKIDEAKINTRAIILKKKRIEFPLRKNNIRRMALDPDLFNFKGDIFLYENKIALSVFSGKQYSILINSKQLAETLRALFELSFKK